VGGNSQVPPVGLGVVTAFAWTPDRLLGHPGLGERYRGHVLEVPRRRLAAEVVTAGRAEPDL